MKKQSENKPKSKTLFDHLKEITQIKRDNYWQTLNDADKKTWSTYMVNRYLSMNDEWTQTVDDLQQYTISNALKPELVYTLYKELLPQSTVFLKYIKSINDKKYSKELKSHLMKYYNISEKESVDYLNILSSTDDGKLEIERILSSYGNDEKQIKKIQKGE